jgi:hypothetical protein
MPDVTPIYNWPIPEDTDLVKDGASAIRDLADGIETTVDGLSGAGLVHINTITTGGNVASQSINDVFSSTYENYVIEIYGTFAATDFANLRLRVGGTDNSTANSYIRQVIEGNSTTASANSESQTSFRVVFRGSTTAAMGRIYLYRPFLALPTFFNVFTGFDGNTSIQNGQHNQSISYTGFSLIANSNQFNAKIITYGLRS